MAKIFSGIGLNLALQLNTIFCAKTGSKIHWIGTDFLLVEYTSCPQERRRLQVSSRATRRLADTRP
jgi:hypothetical protein